MRSSRPIPRATSSTSAPSSSDTFAISLMNEIFVARNAFDASLIISAEATSVRTIGAPSGSYSFSTRSRELSRLGPRAHDHAIGVQEVRDRRALLQELGARDVSDARRGGAGSSGRSPPGTVLFITSAWSVDSPSSSTTFSTR